MMISLDHYFLVCENPRVQALLIELKKYSLTHVNIWIFSKLHNDLINNVQFI